jgi:hypothetical protein
MKTCVACLNVVEGRRCENPACPMNNGWVWSECSCPGEYHHEECDSRLVMVNDVRYEIWFRGAPYGTTEMGHMISCHLTKEKAEKKLTELQNWPKYYNNLVIRQVVRQ